MLKLRTLFEITYRVGDGTKAIHQQIAGADMEETLTVFRRFIYALEGSHPSIICIRALDAPVYVED